MLDDRRPRAGQHRDADARPAAEPRPPIVYELPLAPAVNGLLLRGQGYRTSIGLISNTLFWMVVALSVLTVWMLLGTWRHMRRRAQIQSALVQETNFRRAMENSMLTGMRAMDLEGRITYVNAGVLRDDRLLRGRTDRPRRRPSPTGRTTASTRTAACCSRSCRAAARPAASRCKVMRKDGSLFDARMYVSPLIDPTGQQTGWMTSMTNITEAKRIRDQLSASHERFTTVLEGLDAAVSVLSVQQGELLFANRSYRLWFGADAQRPRAARRRRAGSRCRPTPTSTTRSTALGGLPTQELTEAGSEPARGLRRAAAEVVRRALALPAVDRRPAGADADRHRHHRAAARRGAGRAARPRRRR